MENSLLIIFDITPCTYEQGNILNFFGISPHSLHNMCEVDALLLAIVTIHLRVVGESYLITLLCLVLLIVQGILLQIARREFSIL